MLLTGQAANEYADRFQVEYRDGENWLKYGSPLSLDGSGEINLDLPVYMNGKTDGAGATAVSYTNLDVYKRQAWSGAIS